MFWKSAGPLFSTTVLCVWGGCITLIQCNGFRNSGEGLSENAATDKYSCSKKRANKEMLKSLKAYKQQVQKNWALETKVTENTAQHNTAQHSTAKHSTAQHRRTNHNLAKHTTAPNSTAQNSTAKRSTAQHSTEQHSKIQHSTAQQNKPPLSKAHHSSTAMKNEVNVLEFQFDFLCIFKKM